MLGYRLEDLEGKRFLDFLHPDDLAPTLEAVAHLARQEDVLNFTNRFRHRDGSWRWIEWRSFAAGPVIYAAARDITDRRRTEEALRVSERLTRMVAELTSDYLFHLSVAPSGAITMDHLTANFQDVTGRGADDVAPLEDWRTVVAPEDRDRLEAGMQRLVADQKPLEMEMRSWVRGSLRWVRVHARPELDAAGRRVAGVIGGVKDIDEHRVMEEERARLQAQLDQASKMEAIGRLAGGVAHDFNNLLTSILGNIELALLDLNPADPLARTLQEVNRAAQSAASLTRQLLAFSRKQIIEPRVLDLNDLIERLRQMLVRLLGEDIMLQTIGGVGLGSVRVDPGQFEQVVVNLAVNARDAMPSGGRLVIETANVELDQDYCATHAQAPLGRCVMLAVSDTGHGMTSEVLSHLFEPFFTTKAKERGTGLGLATIYGVVRQAGGSIEVYCEVGHGTTFKVYLPRVDEEAQRWQRTPAAGEAAGGHETVLIVEDEALVRDLAVRILRRLGYRVLAASHGVDALLQAERHEGRIDLLLTDVVMPGMSGRELASRLCPLHPEMKVLYTSGYTENVIVHHGVLEPGLRFISKPYSPQALGAAVRAVLDH